MAETTASREGYGPGPGVIGLKDTLLGFFSTAGKTLRGAIFKKETNWNNRVVNFLEYSQRKNSELVQFVNEAEVQLIPFINAFAEYMETSAKREEVLFFAAGGISYFASRAREMSDGRALLGMDLKHANGEIYYTSLQFASSTLLEELENPIIAESLGLEKIDVNKLINVLEQLTAKRIKKGVLVYPGNETADQLKEGVEEGTKLRGWVKNSLTFGKKRWITDIVWDITETKYFDLASIPRMLIDIDKQEERWEKRLREKSTRGAR